MLFTSGVVHNKVTNMCRGNNPKCDRGKSIEIEAVTCPSPANERLWNITQSEIYTNCKNVKECDISFIANSVSACCGTDGHIKKPRLRFVYNCPTCKYQSLIFIPQNQWIKFINL